MDQQSGDTADKRNWRDRLGIGKTASASELPKLSNEFKDEAPLEAAPILAAPQAAAPIKAAPMAPRAPRAGSAPVAPRPAPAPVRPAPVAAAPRQAPVAPDALASKLRDQREAAERLAQQRIQAAKARAESAQAPQPAAPGGAKPKFSFADQQDGGARPATSWPSSGAPAPRPASVGLQTQPPRPSFQPQIQPPRPQIGGANTPPPAYPSNGQQPSFGQPGQGYGQGYQPSYNPGYSNPYGQQPPSYRPIDPATGYTPPPGFNSQGRGVAPVTPSGVRPPSRGPAASPAFAPQQPQLQIGPEAGQDADSDDIFETAPQRPIGRRATANDYSQAYQDELEYDDQPQRSGSFGMILGLLLLGLLVAFAVVFGYSHFIKNQGASGTGGNVPVVNAPATPSKATPDANTSQQGDAANKKQIYDRIEGDHEVPGGALKSTEQPPAAQQGGDAQPQTGGASNGDASQPVPLPPPPGGNNGQQGSLSPDSNTNVANATPAAGQNPAANSSKGDASNVNVTPASAAPAAASSAAAATPPAAGAQPATQADAMPSPPTTSTAASADGGDEQIGNTKAKPAAKAAAAAKQVSTDAAKPVDSAKSKSLGSAPVVLVPPAKSAATAATANVPVVTSKPSAVVPSTNSAGGGLYGDTGAAAPQQLAMATPKTPAVAAPSAIAASTPKTGTGAYVVKLSSFGSRDEATQEYQRLGAKHGALITRYAPIITQSTVAGSPRYNLNLGPMASNDVATSVCSSLISAGERDCAVGRQ